MKLKQLLKEIKGVFKPPVKQYYWGKIVHGCPYFSPWYFNGSIISIRKLRLRSKEEQEEITKDKPWLKKGDSTKFANVPMVKRSKHWIKKVFGNYYWIEIGWPIMIKWVQLGWKWKWESIRFEWTPSFQIYFFKWQFCIFWEAPDGNDDLYYEMVLWYLKKAKKDIREAEQTWGWEDCKTYKSTWNKYYLI